MDSAILTRRLLLRPYDPPADAPAFLALIEANRPRLRNSFPDRLADVRDLPSAEKTLHGFVRDWHTGRFYVFGIWEQGPGAYLGDICLMPQDRGWAEIGYYLAHEAEGHGYAREALVALVPFGFGRAHAERLLVRCYRDNPRAHAVARAAGFAQEPTPERPRLNFWESTPKTPPILRFVLARPQP